MLQEWFLVLKQLQLKQPTNHLNDKHTNLIFFIHLVILMYIEQNFEQNNYLCFL